MDSSMHGRSSLAPAMAMALRANFGSVERWRDEFVALAESPAEGLRWLALCFQPRDARLVNRRAADLDQALADATALVALDLFERGDGAAPGAAAGAEAFVDGIDWAAPYERYQHAVHEASELFGADASEPSGAMRIDVRRAEVFEQAKTVIPGARWLDPAAVGTWAGTLPADREVVVYCVYGHEVGRATAMRLRAAGVKARFLRGGIDAWQSAGRTLEPKEVAS